MTDRKPTAREVLLEPRAGASAEELDLLEKRFFNQLVLANGTLKTTYSGRLGDVDAACNELLGTFNPPVRLLDIGVSSGVTTWEWSQALAARDIDFELDAFDLCVDAHIVSFGERFKVLIDSSGRPLQFEVFGRTEENVLGEATARRIKRALPIALLRTSYSLGRGFARDRQAVQLVTRHLRDSANIRVFEFDVANLDRLDRRYEMIRAANILNLAYFDESFLAAVLAKAKTRLEPGGYLCVVRTHADDSNHGTIFRLEGDRFEAVTVLGEGSEISHLVTAT